MAGIMHLGGRKKGSQMRITIPSFVRDTVFVGVQSVEVELCEDPKGKFIKIRPIKTG